MPTSADLLPLEVNDHVLLDDSIGVDTQVPHVRLVIPAGEHGMVVEVSKSATVVRFGHIYLRLAYHTVGERLTLVRSNQDSKRRE